MAAVVNRMAKCSPRMRKLASIMQAQSEPPFRAKQLAERIYRGFVPRYSALPGLPNSLKSELVAQMNDEVLCVREAERSVSSQATKVLFELPDKQKVESVHMRFENGHTSLCISSQVGCAMACSFCRCGALMRFFPPLSRSSPALAQSASSAT
jgi:23S rRNA (adenine-C8)-methyltransferase